MDDGPARQNEIADTLRKLRKLVIFSGDELTENLPLYLNSESLLEEIEARVEDAKLYMQGQARTARATGGQRQWLARGVSPERELEKRAARATSWVEFTQAEIDAMTPTMRHAMTARFAIPRQRLRPKLGPGRRPKRRLRRSLGSRRPSTTLRSPRPLWRTSRGKSIARKKQEALAAIEEQAAADLLRYERDLQAAKEESMCTARREGLA